MRQGNDLFLAVLQHAGFVDWFFYSRSLWNMSKVARFVLGGPRFDNWLLALSITEGKKRSVDATRTVKLFHLNHSYRDSFSGNNTSLQNNFKVAASIPNFDFFLHVVGHIDVCPYVAAVDKTDGRLKVVPRFGAPPPATRRRRRRES